MDSLTHLIIFHRRLGCIDESATDEEQGEKVLYYYPKTSLYWQLSRINMLEGLIEFSSKFSKDIDIDIVIMQNTTWVFYQCEPDIWIVVGMSNVPSSIPSNTPIAAATNHGGSQSPAGRKSGWAGTVGFHKHVPNGKGLLVAIKKMYEMFSTFHGRIEDIISRTFKTRKDDGTDESPVIQGGWSTVAKVAELRKKKRKLNQKLKQLYQDVETLTSDEMDRQLSDTNSTPFNDEEPDGEATVTEASQSCVKGCEQTCKIEMGQEPKSVEVQERLGFRTDMGSKDDLNNKIAEIKTDIGVATAELTTILHSNYYTPYIIKRNLLNFLEMYILSGELLFPSLYHSMPGVHLSPVGHPAFQALLRVRQVIEEATGRVCRSNNHGSGLGTIILHDGDIIWNELGNDNLASVISRYMRLQEYSLVRDSFRWCFSTTGSSVPDEESDLEEDQDNVEGSSSDGDEDEGFYDEQGRDGGLDSGVKGPQNDEALLNDVVDGATAPAAGPGKRTIIGNVRSVMKRFMSNSGSGDVSADIAYKAYQKQLEEEWLDGITNRRGFISTRWSITDCDEVAIAARMTSSSSISGLDDGGGLVGNSETPDLSKENNNATTDTNALPGNSIYPPMSDNDTVLQRYFSHLLSLSPKETDRATLHMCMKNGMGLWCPRIYEASADAHGERNPTEPMKCLGRLLVYQQGRFSVVFLVPDWVSDGEQDIESGSSSNCTVSSTAAHPDMYTSFATQASVTGIQGNANSTTSSSNPGDAAIVVMCGALQRALVDELDRLYNILGQPTTIIGIAPKKKYQLSPNVKLIYHNNANQAVKIANVYKHKVDPLNMWPFNIANPSPPLCLSENIPQHRGEKGTVPSASVRIYDSVGELRPRFALPPPLLSLSTDPLFLMSLNEIWESISGESTHDLNICEGCIRVRALHKGGMWVIGRKTMDRNVYLAIEKCATLSDAHEILSHTTSGVLASVLI